MMILDMAVKQICLGEVKVEPALPVLQPVIQMLQVRIIVIHARSKSYI